MTALPQDAVGDLQQRIAELQRQLETAVSERDAAIERQTASALVNFRLKSELRAATERQNASAEILNAIANTQGDAEHALQRIAEATQHFFNAASATIRIAEGDRWVQTVRVGSSGHLTGSQPTSDLATPGSNLPATIYHENRQVHIPDLDNVDPAMANWPATAARAAGIRTICGTPLRRDGRAIGALIVYRDRLAAFTDDELALQQSFADQAVIAIENARLFNETQQSLTRQDATAEILRTVASTPGNADQSLRQIAETSGRLFGAPSVTLFLAENGEWTKTYRFGASSQRIGSALPLSASPVGGRNLPGRVVADDRQIHVPDLDNLPPDMADWPGLPHARAAGTRTACGTPLRREGKAIGALLIFRDRLAPFTEQELALQQSFADQAVIAIENARLFNETQEALERQTATADILKVIASSPSEVQPVFDAILARALQLCEAAFGFLTLYDGETFEFGAQLGVPPVLAEHFSGGMDQPRPGDAHWRLLEGEDLVHNLDQKDEDAYRSGNPLRRAVVDLGDARSALVVALRKGGSLRGSITIYRKEVKPFSTSQIELLRHFADQAVIAIENTRLFNEVEARTVELTEALEQQTATAEVLGVISSSPGDLAPVFDAMLGKAMQLCSANFGVLNTHDGKAFHTAATYGLPPAYDEFRRSRPQEYGPATAPARLLKGEPFIQFTDLLESEAYRNGEPNRRALVDIGGARCLLAVPLLKDERVIGNVLIFRQENRPFSEKQIALLQQFAAQAVIAIENTRLLRELRESTEDLSESLQQQTATSEVLQIISSSPGELGPVFDKMLENATRVCGAEFGSMLLVEDGGLRQAALYNAPAALAAVRANRVSDYDPQSGPALAISSRQVVQIEDVRTTAAYLKRALATVQIAELGGARTIVVVPMLRDDEAIGSFTVYRQEVRPFSEKQVELLTNFARQAVIAIENARLLRELRQRTDDLSEALTYQTGSANILRVIASSPTDVEPVLKAIVESASDLCGADDAVVLLKDGDDLRFSAHHGPIPINVKKWPINRSWAAGRAILDRVPVHLPDIFADDSGEFNDSRELSLKYDRTNIRSVLSVPLLRESESIGAITLRRTEQRAFDNKQIELLQTFADQAVIAIGNVRLFEEVQAKTRDLEESLQFQTASSDVLKVISSSPDALQPVLDVIVETSRELCGCDATTIFLLRDGKFHVTAVTGSLPAHLDHLKANPLTVGQPGSVLSRVYHRKCTLHYPNVMDDPELSQGSTGLGGARALLTVPLISDGQVIGAITLRQSIERPFTPRQIQAIETFADQAVIAISNVNLFEQVQQRTRELSKSLDDLRTAQDRLIQTEKLASLGQLTAGIAHEIKNPLNFVNNFAALSAELTDELKDVLKPAVLDETIRAEVDEVTGLLKDNLSKVVQHGKRADSIVKNMLLHSREGTGEHRPADVNALVDESLNLAYHGARAEKPQFNVTLQRDFDPRAGTVEVFPQEITRVLLNLISNGFYAVTKRKADNGGGDYEPLVTATTRGSDDHVEIRIRDNGTGIPPEVKEKMFNPFFTTKPAGEGTGLGLSMSHDIVVKQHGGSIEVETEPGAFTEFRLVLPRTSLARTNGNR